MGHHNYGSRKYRSPELASIHLTDNIQKSVHKGELFGVLFMDFNSVSVNKLNMSKYPFIQNNNINKNNNKNQTFSEKIKKMSHQN